MTATDWDAGTPVVETTGVSKTFRGRVSALDGVSISVQADSIVGLLGRNGAGKTTLMSLITGQDFASSGSVRVFGENPVENDRVLSQTCFIRESQVYPNNFRVSHVLSAGKSFYPHWDAELADQLIETFALPRKRQVQKLSRGMRSSVGILVGLASRAPLTIFDEPYLGLDATARQQFYDILLKDYAENPRTVVLSTHLIDEVSGLLSDAIVLDRGRVALAGSADDLRGRASVLSGPVDAVESMIRGVDVMHRESLGAYESVTVDVRLDEDLRREANRLGVELNPASLQTLVVRAGQNEEGERR